MKIRMLTSIAGVDFALMAGDETERFSDAEVARFLAAGIAEELVSTVREIEPPSGVIEVAAVAPAERATSRRKKV